jgi:hypothetical protein
MLLSSSCIDSINDGGHPIMGPAFLHINFLLLVFIIKSSLYESFSSNNIYLFGDLEIAMADDHSTH